MRLESGGMRCLLLLRSPDSGTVPATPLSVWSDIFENRKEIVVNIRIIAGAIFVIFIAMVVSACPKSSPARFDFTPPPAEWTPLRGEDGTLLFRKDSPPMGITVYTTCDRYLSAPPSALARNLFIGFKNRRIIERGAAGISGMEAHYIIMECTLEGTPLKVKAYTFKTNRCIYDIVYFALPEQFDTGLAAFEEFAREFRAMQ